MQGRTYDEALAELSNSQLDEQQKPLIAKQKVMLCNKPKNTLMMEKLTTTT